MALSSVVSDIFEESFYLQELVTLWDVWFHRHWRASDCGAKCLSVKMFSGVYGDTPNSNPLATLPLTIRIWFLFKRNLL